MSKDCDPDRSDRMRSYEAVTHDERMPATKIIRDTPEGRRVAKDWSRDPHQGGRR